MSPVNYTAENVASEVRLHRQLFAAIKSMDSSASALGGGAAALAVKAPGGQVSGHGHGGLLLLVWAAARHQEGGADCKLRSLGEPPREGRALSGSAPLSGLVTWFAEKGGCQGRSRFTGPKAPLTPPFSTTPRVFQAATHDPATVHGMVEDYRAGLGIDRQHDEDDRSAGRKLACPLLVLWSDLEDLHGDILGIWRGWASNVRGCSIDCCHHHIAEKAPEVLAAELGAFFQTS